MSKKKILAKKLGSFGRDTSNYDQLIKGFDEMGVAIRFLDDRTSVEGTMGKIVVTILSMVAQAEFQRILEKTDEGSIEVKGKSVKFNRKDVQSEITCQMYIRKSTVYKIVAERTV